MAPINPQRGEIWRAQLDPGRGSEQGKTRPVVVLSQPPTGRPTMRICAPVMNSLPIHGRLFWCVALSPDQTNGLTKESTVDASQTRALDTVRFEAHLGELAPDEADLIAQALTECIKRAPAPGGAET